MSERYKRRLFLHVALWQQPPRGLCRPRAWPASHGTLEQVDRSPSRLAAGPSKSSGVTHAAGMTEDILRRVNRTPGEVCPRPYYPIAFFLVAKLPRRRSGAEKWPRSHFIVSTSLLTEPSTPRSRSARTSSARCCAVRLGGTAGTLCKHAGTGHAYWYRIYYP